MHRTALLITIFLMMLKNSNQSDLGYEGLINRQMLMNCNSFEHANNFFPDYRLSIIKTQGQVITVGITLNPIPNACHLTITNDRSIL